MQRIRRKRYPRGWVIWISWISITYLLFVALIWLLIARFGDRWWPATVLMFGPRWMWGLPLIALVPWALLARRWRALVALGVALLLVLVPIMGWRWNWQGDEAAPYDLRVITFNIGNSYRGDEVRVAVPELRRLFDISRADLLFLQECSFDQESLFAYFPDMQLHSSGGSCVVSRYRISNVAQRDRDDVQALGGSGMIDRFEFEAPRGVISVVNLHLETVRGGMERVVARSFYAAAAMDSNASVRRIESAVAVNWAARARVPLLVVGDFNMPVESAIYRRYWAVLGNAFDSCGEGYGYTKFERRYGIRIDHVLFDRHWSCVKAIVDPSVGGDHRPLIVDLRLRR